MKFAYYSQFHTMLAEIGYNGYFALELDHPEPFEDGVAQALSFLPPLWEGGNE